MEVRLFSPKNILAFILARMVFTQAILFSPFRYTGKHSHLLLRIFYLWGSDTEIGTTVFCLFPQARRKHKDVFLPL